MNKTKSATTVSEEKSVMGVLVHLIGLFFSLFGAGIVFILSRNDFTRANARNALNWHIFFFIGSIALGGLAIVLGGLSDLLGILFVLGVILLILLDFAFCLWAAVKAFKGREWTYPIAPEFV